MSHLLRAFFLPLLLVLLCHATYAGALKGTVTDEKNESLPFATVYVKGTTIGTSANAEGTYQLSLEPGSYTVICQYIGFKQTTAQITIHGQETVTHNFRLESQSYQMQEHRVKASEDPANYIMRKAIERREFFGSQIRSFETGIYLKGVLKTREIPKRFMGQKIEAEDMGLDSTGKGFLYLVEQVATYYTNGEQAHTVTHSVRESGNPNGVGLSVMPPVISFYKNLVSLGSSATPRGVISPLNDNAFHYYRFKLEGDFTEDGKTIFKIKVTPKRSYEPLFTGTIFIVDNEWAIHSLDLLVTKTSGLQMLDTVRLEQVYLPLQQDQWVVKQQVVYPSIKIFGFDLVGYFVTVYDNQKVNEPLPDSVFQKRIIASYDQDATKKDTSYWEEKRPIPLVEEEQSDYRKKDSMRIVDEDPVRRDSLRKKGNKFHLTDVLLTGYGYSGKDDKFTVTTNSLLLGMINYNTVEGINIAPRFQVNYKLDTFKTLSFEAATRYGFENEHFNAIGQLSLTRHDRYWRGRYSVLGIEGGKYVFQFNPEKPIDYLYNTFATLLYRVNYLKIYEKWQAGVLYRRNWGNGLSLSARLSYQKRLPLQNSTDFSFAGEDKNGFTDNTPTLAWAHVWEEHEAVIGKLALRWQPGFNYVQYPGYKVPVWSRKPIFTLNYEKGIPELLNSRTDYDKWSLGMEHSLDLKLFGDLKYNLETGGFLNDKYVSIPDLNHINGNELSLASPYLKSFQLAPYYFYSNKKPLYGEAHIEWHLKGFLTNKIPLFRRLRWHLVGGSNLYYVDENFYHLEAFAGLDNLGFGKLRMFRLDLVHAWNSFDRQTVGVRLGLSMGAIQVSMGSNDTEW